MDGLILSILSYVHFDNLVPPDPARSYLSWKGGGNLSGPAEGRRGRVRCPLDRKLLAALARCRRLPPWDWPSLRTALFREEEMQFAAIAVLLEDGSAFFPSRAPTPP